MSRNTRDNIEDLGVLGNDVLSPAWQRLADDFARLSTKAFKRRLKTLSRNEQELTWKAISEQDPGRFEQALAVADTLKRDVRRIENIACGAWADDFKSVAPAAKGEFPPGGESCEWRDANSRSGRCMVRAAGEKRLYPPHTVGSRGLNYEIELEILHTGSSRPLLTRKGKHRVIRKRDFDAPPVDDGYRGGVISIYDIPHADRARFRRKPNGKHGASNSIDFDGIPD